MEVLGTVTRSGTLRDAIRDAARQFTFWRYSWHERPQEVFGTLFGWYEIGSVHAFCARYATPSAPDGVCDAFLADENRDGSALSLLEWCAALAGATWPYYFLKPSGVHAHDWIDEVQGAVVPAILSRISADCTGYVELNALVHGLDDGIEERAAHILVLSSGVRLLCCPITVWSGSLDGPGYPATIGAVSSVMPSPLTPTWCTPVAAESTAVDRIAQAVEDLAGQDVTISLNQGRTIYSVKSQGIVELPQ